MTRRRWQMVFAVGERVQVTEKSPWPERVGCVGTVVAPPADGTYPQPARGETLVLLDDDPLAVATPQVWSCVIGSRDLRLVSR